MLRQDQLLVIKVSTQPPRPQRVFLWPSSSHSLHCPFPNPWSFTVTWAFSFPCTTLTHLAYLSVDFVYCPSPHYSLSMLHHRRPLTLLMAVSPAPRAVTDTLWVLSCVSVGCTWLLPFPLPFISQPSVTWWPLYHSLFPPGLWWFLSCLSFSCCISRIPLTVLTLPQLLKLSALCKSLLSWFAFPLLPLRPSSRLYHWCHFFTLACILPPCKSELTCMTCFG